jgi:magnesium-transporting ATPase (P-type)
MTLKAVSPGSGLSSSQAARRLQEDGPNVLPSPKGPSWIRALVAQLSHFFALMLWVAAGLALLAGMPQLAGAIAVVVVVNGVFAFVQEFRADQAGKRLRDLLPVQVTVVRDNHRQVVAASTLVRGDLIALEAGDRVCADLRLQEVQRTVVIPSTRPDVGLGLTQPVAQHLRLHPQPPATV